MTTKLALCWLAALLLFGIWPGIDIWVAGLFFDEAAGEFPLARSGLLELLRSIIWNAANALSLIALVFGIYALFATPAPAVPGRLWGFALLLIFLGPVLLVNVVLKGFWGRARPADTDIFGGPYPFTPAWEFAGNCPSNCSFTSGEAAAVACVALLVGMALWHRVKDRRWLIWALVVLVIIGAGLRVAKGRHYVSDVTWSVLMMVTLAHWLAARLGVGPMLDRLTWPALRSDGMRIVLAAKNWGQRWRG